MDFERDHYVGEHGLTEIAKQQENLYVPPEEKRVKQVLQKPR